MVHVPSGEDDFLNLQSVIDCASDAIFVTGPSDLDAAGHKILHVNAAFTEQTGYRADDVIGQPPTVLFGRSTDPAARQCILNALERCEAISLSALHYRKDGSDYWSKLSIKPMVTDGKCRHCVALLQRTDKEAQITTASTESERPFLQLAEGLSEAVLVHRNLRPIFVNSAYLDLFGFTSQAEALRENSFLLNLSATHRAAVNPTTVDTGDISGSIKFDAVNIRGQSLQLEARYQTIDWRGAPAVLMTIQRSAQHAVPHMLRRQIAKRTQSIQTKKSDGTEAALAESRRLMDLLVDSVPVWFAYKDRDLNFKFVNQAFADSVNLSPEAIIGRNVLELRGEKHIQEMQDKYAAVFSGETVTFAMAREVYGLGTRELILTMVPHKDESGEILGYFSLSQDITDVKIIERALAEHQEQLRLVIDSVPALISYRDRNLRFRYVNKTCEAWFGLPASQIIGRHMSEISDLNAFRALKPYVDRVLTGETVEFEQVIPLPRLGERTLLVSYVPHKAETGHVIGFFTVTQDITRIREARHEMHDVAAIFSQETNRLPG